MKNQPSKPLDGIKVLEIASVVAGPTAGWVLAALGAEVTKIESKTSTEREMQAGPPGYFVSLNRGKRSIAMDLKDSKGKEIVYKIVRRSDILIESLGPGTMDKLGFSYNTLREINPRLIYSSIKGFGPGPYQNRLGYDMAMQADTGLLYMTGSEEKPMRMGTSVIDINCAIFLCLGIVLALKDRDLTGEGKRIESNLFETALFLMNYTYGSTQVLKESPPPQNTPGLWYPIYDIFETKDKKKIFLGVTSDSQWVRFCEEFDLKELLSEKYSTHKKRMQERPNIIPLVTKVISNFSREELIKKIEGIKVVFACVNTPLEALEHPQLKGPNKMCEVNYASLKEPIKAPMFHVLIDDYIPPAVVTAPELGENTNEILHGLGYTQDEIEEFMRKGIIKQYKNEEVKICYSKD